MTSPSHLLASFALLPFIIAVRPLAAEEPIKAGTPVWLSERPAPKTAELSDIAGMQFHTIKAWEPGKDGHVWLHGVALAWHKDRLYATFGHNKGEENTVGEEARGRVSSDGGKTWSEPFTIDDDKTGGLGVSHGVLLSKGDELWAFQGAFYGSSLKAPDAKVHTRAYRLNESTGAWEKKGVVIDHGFWPMQEPLKMVDGNWIMSGIRVGEGHPAAVAISHGDDLTRWDLVLIPRPHIQDMWGESVVIVDGKRVQNFARFGGQALTLTAISEDSGRIWSESLPSNLPMATAKPYAGTLSTGQRYLICSTTADGGKRRSPLTIAVGKPGENGFRKVLRIRGSLSTDSAVESNARGGLSYPYAVEHDGKLYVGYSNNGGRRGNHNSAELAVIPVGSLRVE